METVYKSSKAVILFLIIVLLAQSFVSDKFAQNMTLAILFSMLIIKSDIISSWLDNITKDLTAKE